MPRAKKSESGPPLKLGHTEEGHGINVSEQEPVLHSASASTTSHEGPPIVFDEYASFETDTPKPAYLIEPGQSFTAEQWEAFSTANEQAIRDAIEDYETLVKAIDPDAMLAYHWSMSADKATSYVRGMTETQGIILALLVVPSSFEQMAALALANVRMGYVVAVDWETGEVYGAYDLR